MLTMRKDGMPYRYNRETREVFCETATQMAAFLHALEEKQRLASGTPSATHSSDVRVDAPEEVPTLASVVAGLQKRTRQYVEILAETPEGVLDSKVATALGLQKRAHVTAIVASLDTALKKADLRVGQVIQRSKHFNGGGRDHLSIIRPELCEEVRKSLKQH